MKLLLTALRTESFELVTSIKNIKKMHAYQLEQTKTLEDLKENNEIADQFVSEYEIKYLERAEAFIKEILLLSDKEVEKLESLDRTEFMMVQSKIILSLQGYDSETIEKIFSENKQESKK